MQKKLIEIGVSIVALAAIAPALALIVCLDSLILVQLWKWFLIPMFNLAPLSIPNAIGLSGIAGFLTHRSVYKPDRELKWWEKCQGIINDLWIFCVCWVAHFFL